MRICIIITNAEILCWAAHLEESLQLSQYSEIRDCEFRQFNQTTRVEKAVKVKVKVKVKFTA
jgi:hypothetical protein